MHLVSIIPALSLPFAGDPADPRPSARDDPAAGGRDPEAAGRAAGVRAAGAGPARPAGAGGEDGGEGDQRGVQKAGRYIVHHAEEGVHVCVSMIGLCAVPK